MTLIPEARADDPWLTNLGPLWRASRLPNGVRTAMVSCGNGHAASLSEHTIASDGTVSPSLQCPVKDCPWHHHVRLDGWRA